MPVDMIQLSAAEPSAVTVRSWRGSKFWVLDGENSDRSEDEADDQMDGDHMEREWGSDRKLVRDAARAGVSVDEIIRAESLLRENFRSPQFASMDRGAGHISHRRPLASKIAEAVADIHFKGTGKPWKGPLPKSHPPHSRQLGHIMVKDLRHSNSNGTAKSLSDLCSQVSRHIDFDSEKRESGQLSSGSARGTFWSRLPRGVGLERIDPDMEVKVGSHPTFKATRGLRGLFMARGMPRRLREGKEVLRAAACARQGFPSRPQSLSYSEAMGRGSKVERRAEPLKMVVGNQGGR